MSLICFDLEGPLATQDNAYELMKLFPGGDGLFQIISRYDDLLTLECRPNYEPGDTLALIAPFLIYHRISEKDISALARKATITKGATSLISLLAARGWSIFCISTSYEQYALRIARRLNIPIEHVACTAFPLDKISQKLNQSDFYAIEAIEKEILSTTTVHDDRVKRRLDSFYWQELPKTNLGLAIKQVKPVGGQHKVDALKHFAQLKSRDLRNWVVVGDSITDFKMLRAVDRAKGLAIAFNANQYALPCATISLASTHLDDLWPVLETWNYGGRPAVRKLVNALQKAGGGNDRRYFHWIKRSDLSGPLEIHMRIRRIVRERAADLG